MFASALCVAVVTAFWSTGHGFPGQNTPPVFEFKREWIISETEPVESRITTVRTRDDENDPIEYGIVPALYLDGSNYFKIDKNTGEVRLAEPLNGQAGNNFYLYVTANDGHQTAKIEVYVEVVKANGRPREPTLDVPFSTSWPPRSGGDGSHLRPFPPFQRPGPAFVPAAPDATPSSPPGFPPFKKTRPSPSSRTPPPARRHDPASPPSSSFAPVVPPHAPSPTLSPPLVVFPGLNDVTSGIFIGGGARGGPAGTASPSSSPVPPTTAAGGPGLPLDEGKAAAGPGQRFDVTATVFPIIATVAFAPVVAVVFWLLHKRCRREEKLKSDKKIPDRRESNISDDMDLNHSSSVLYLQRTPRAQPNRYEFMGSMSQDQKWEFPRHHLRFLGILGEGCFGQVWKCEALNICNSEGNSLVAVKTLKENASEKEKKDLLSELEVMKLLDPHPHVVTLLGCCTEREPIFVIMEYVANGKLQSFLRESRAERFYGNLHASSRHLTSRDLTSFAYQVAKGMEYLSSKGVIHRDLAARNILVGENKTCKVADFGFARDVIVNHIYERKSEGRLPIRWMAPESLYDNIFTSKTDVWSFGILMWEIVTLGSTPYPGMSAPEVMRRVREGYRLDKPDHCKREMYNLMFYCWDKDPARRPSFSELVRMLDKLLISENEYIELDRFPDHSYYNITGLSGEIL